MAVTFTKGGGTTPAGEGLLDASGSLELVEGGTSTFQINDEGRGDFSTSGNLAVLLVRYGATGITAYATGGQANATALVARYNNITTCATAADSVALKAAALGEVQTVKNSGATTCAVFPASGDSINALAVNLSVDLPPGAELTFFAISATVWETRESLYLPAPTTQNGGLEIKAADAAGNTTTTVTNASQAAARTYTIPDAGASAGFLMTEGAQALNGVQTFTAPAVEDHNTGITAFATGGQASAVALAGRWNNVTTCATAGDSVQLLAAVAGQVQTVKNSGAAALDVFPGSSDAINALAADLAVRIPPGAEVTFRAIDATTWETNEGAIFFAPSTVSGGLEIKAADSAGDFITTLTNASMGQASTISIPDPGAASADFVLDEAVQTIAGLKTFSGANVHSAANLYSAGAAAAAVALRLGASATEGWEIRAVDETVTCDAVSKDLTENVPDGAVILSVQGNKETAGAAAGTTTNWGIGTAGNPDLYSPTVGALTLDAKIDHIPDYAVNSGAVDVQVHGVTAGGAIGDTAPGGTARVRIVYAALNSLDNA